MTSLKQQELKDEILRISSSKKFKELSSIVEFEPRDMEEGMDMVDAMIYIANVVQLKKFLVDRNCKGEKPELIVSSPHTDPVLGTDDVFYMPNEPKYNQEILDMLKKQLLIPDDSTMDDYDFLLRK